MVCLMADFGLKQGEEARNKVTFHGEKDCPNYGFHTWSYCKHTMLHNNDTADDIKNQRLVQLHACL